MQPAAGHHHAARAPHGLAQCRSQVQHLRCSGVYAGPVDVRGMRISDGVGGWGSRRADASGRAPAVSWDAGNRSSASRAVSTRSSEATRAADTGGNGGREPTPSESDLPSVMHSDFRNALAKTLSSNSKHSPNGKIAAIVGSAQIADTVDDKDRVTPLGRKVSRGQRNHNAVELVFIIYYTIKLHPYLQELGRVVVAWLDDATSITIRSFIADTLGANGEKNSSQMNYLTASQ